MSINIDDITFVNKKVVQVDVPIEPIKELELESNLLNNIEIELGYNYKYYVNNIIKIAKEKGKECAICYQQETIKDQERSTTIPKVDYDDKILRDVVDVAKNRIKGFGDLFSISVVYILLLEGGNYYVGTSSNFVERMKAHFIDKCASNWTIKHHPLELVDVMKGSDTLELETTLLYMKKYGIEKVRGSYWCWVDIPNDIKKELEWHLEQH